MISICIPIYNFNVIPLISELSRQAKLISVPYEILLIDDHSSEAFRKVNKAVCETETYIELDQNIGRAKIRNHFLKYSKYDNLLFLDCDSLIISDDFLSKYIAVIKGSKYNIVCGGRVYSKSRPKRYKMLRWKYGINKESQPVNIRTIWPNKFFMTNNFMIQKELFERINFDERIIEYGHEDTLFSYRLKKEGIAIKHIDNSVLNGDIEDNIEYLQKTEKGIINLIYILRYVNYDIDFIEGVTILKFYNTIESIKITSFIQFLFICFKPWIRFLLIQGYINLKLFDFYKLGILIQNNRRLGKSELSL